MVGSPPPEQATLPKIQDEHMLNPGVSLTSFAASTTHRLTDLAVNRDGTAQFGDDRADLAVSTLST